jgi:hypothetical protein
LQLLPDNHGASGTLLRICLAAATSALVSAPAAADAQQAVLRGLVLDDATGQAVADAQVTAGSTARRKPGTAVTDRAGSFTLALSAGEHLVTAARLGYVASQPMPLTLDRGDTMHVEIRLAADAVLLAPITVVARPAPRHTNTGLAGFFERLESGQRGWFMTREQIAARSATDVAHLLNGSGYTVIGGGRSRRALVGGRTNCPPEIYLDGTRLTRYERASPQFPEGKHRIAMEALDMINPTSLEGVEVYQGPASIPGEYGGSTGQCGVILFWTRRGGT